MRGQGLGGRLKRAIWWGLAIRLAQRLSGGARGALGQTSLSDVDGLIELRFAPGAASLRGELVDKRLRQLATAIGRDWRIVLD
jgi:exopolyphosphatase/guanosine-5'-triphosphate,3'-diphosphate pyrophosphatase